VFLGPTHDVTLTDGQRVTATLTATFQTSFLSGTVRVDVCYQSGGGTPAEFIQGGYLEVDLLGNLAYTVSATRTFAAGTYTIGYCVENTSADVLNFGWVQGWAMVT
jgi:hypothetical protein